MRLQAGIGTIAVLAFAGAGCSSGSKSLDQADVEQEISRGLEEDVGVAPEAIDCEGIAEIDVTEGNTFLCVGTAPNGDNFDVMVTLTNDDGGFSAVVPG